ncbi:putative Ubiquitin-like domain-containing protein [Helianthus annuus]|nr:putative Ubiquitin-like domain-containing protein [Helianthus annuus]
MSLKIVVSLLTCTSSTVDGSTLTATGNSFELTKIFVNTFTGKTISLFVNPKSTIEHVKWEIGCKEDIPCDEQALIYNNMVLEDSSTLLDFHIYRNSALTLMRKPSQLMSIFIKTLIGKIITVEVKTLGDHQQHKSQDQVRGKYSM